MHSIRSSARREAWRYKNGETNYNPFARNTRRSQQTDDEESLRAVHTADSVPSQLEQDRREKTASDYPHPHRAGTAPTGPSEGRPHAQSDATPASSDTVTAIDSRPRSLQEKEKSDEPAELTNGDRERDTSGAHETKSGLRKRMFGKLHRNNTAETTGSSRSGKKKKHRKIPVGEQLRAIFLSSYINILLLLVPVGIALAYAPNINGIAIFVVNFIAIIPLAATLSFATEELALYVGETLGGLLNATFGNATELIVSIIALAQRKILIVQTSLIGSMLSNLLLVLGMCFFLGGVNRVKQHFNITVAQTASSLLALSIGSLIIPTAFVRFGTSTDEVRTRQGVAPISRGTSIILLFVYGSYLLFQLRTHTDMYNEKSAKGVKRNSGTRQEGEAIASLAHMGARQAAATGGHVNRENLVHSPEEEEEEPTLSIVGALVTLGISTVLIAFCSEFMVSGIDSIADHISQEFIGLILIPIVGNAAEHATAITVAIKDKMDLAIGVAVGSSMQIALLVLPLMVVIGWCGLGKPELMTLDFDGFQVAVLFIAVLLVNYLIQDGESHYLEGILLMATYLIIAVSAWFYPVNGEVAG